MAQRTEVELTRVLTSLPVTALAQPLADFLKTNGIDSLTTADNKHLGLNNPAQVLVAELDLERAKAFLEDFWAANEGSGDEM